MIVAKKTAWNKNSRQATSLKANVWIPGQSGVNN